MCWAGRMEQAGHLSNYLFYLHNFLSVRSVKRKASLTMPFSSWNDYSCTLLTVTVHRLQIHIYPYL